MESGHAWVVDAYGCDPAPLKSWGALAVVFDEIVDDLALKPLKPPVWHQFPTPGGVTGFLLLTESHLSVHTFPERGFAAFDLYCCRERPEWAWEERLKALLKAERVTIRKIGRGEATT